MFWSHISRSTVTMLDKYTDSGEKYLAIRDKLCFTVGRKYFRVHILISNKVPLTIHEIDTNITLTDFKKLYDFCKGMWVPNLDELEDWVKLPKILTAKKITLPVYGFLMLLRDSVEKNYGKYNELILFEEPISINAQSSYNRSGYGSWGNGTFYGETDDYPIVGYILSDDDFDIPVL